MVYNNFYVDITANSAEGYDCKIYKDSDLDTMIEEISIGEGHEIKDTSYREAEKYVKKYLKDNETRLLVAYEDIPKTVYALFGVNQEDSVQDIFLTDRPPFEGVTQRTFSVDFVGGKHATLNRIYSTNGAKTVMTVYDEKGNVLGKGEDYSLFDVHTLKVKNTKYAVCVKPKCNKSEKTMVTLPDGKMELVTAEKPFLERIFEHCGQTSKEKAEVIPKFHRILNQLNINCERVEDNYNHLRLEI